MLANNIKNETADNIDISTSNIDNEITNNTTDISANNRINEIASKMANTKKRLMETASGPQKH